MIRKILKWTGIVLGSLIGLLAVAATVLYVIGSARLGKTYNFQAEVVAIPSDQAAIQHGEHVAQIHFCQECHMGDFSGTVKYTLPGLLTIPTPNLTSGAGGVGSVYTDEDWVRALRHGVGYDGRALWIMPSASFSRLSDEDLGDLIAYVRSQPPVDHQLPARTIAPLGRMMLALNMIPPVAVDQIDHTAAHPVTVPSDPTAEYGQYLVMSTCIECHGVELNGAPFGPPGNEKPTPNLTPGGELVGWSEEDFVTAMRTGHTPSGHQLNGEEMPWPYFGQMTDTEIEAVWLYLQALPAREQGGLGH